MSEARELSKFAVTAHRGAFIEPLPESPKQRFRIGEELQPVGYYANVNPYHRTIQDIEAVQEQEKQDPEFESKDWWWDHRRIGFLNGKLGLKFLILILPFTWIMLLWFGGPGLLIWGIGEFGLYRSLHSLVVVIGLLLLALGWYAFAIWVTPVTTNWLMSTGIGFFLKPFEKSINKKLDKTFEDGCSEFNRLTGQVRFALGRGRFFAAPLVEFDAYVERVVQQGGIFYRLMLVHRYTGKTFNQTSLSNIEANKSEVLALWDMLQRYMDVTQPLPDVPRLEPFRHLDPVTREHDEKTGRDPRYWRDLDIEAWKQGAGVALLNRLRSYPWGSRVCKLTPQLGKISLQEYREMRPEGAWPI
ncbi:hypothetical protein MD273_17650 [Marinobacter pelagius]|uniref:hypothetical protein n=1 Tax=Marinobacter sp. C7 TaxID=2951363 RepID=UPI001EF09CCA|nr:hypothetical protein [Marinobacter sp. C7]MCG7201566.1 hypothetical protein [Marinobacter sp. C7]